MAKMDLSRSPGTPAVVLNADEVARLMAAADDLKYKAAFLIAYGAGLRTSALIGLMTSDIERQGARLRIQAIKGSEPFHYYVSVSPLLLKHLHQWLRVARAQGLIVEGGWLFPALNPCEQLSSAELNRTVRAVALTARIDKPVSMDTLRRSLATHFYQEPVSTPLRTIVRFARKQQGHGATHVA